MNERCNARTTDLGVPEGCAEICQALWENAMDMVPNPVRSKKPESTHYEDVVVQRPDRGLIGPHSRRCEGVRVSDSGEYLGIVIAAFRCPKL